MGGETIMSDESKALKLVRWIADKGIEGVSPLTGSEDLATEYLIDKGYRNNDERVDSLINWEMSKNFTSGFITGLGGILTLPVAVPAGLGASWVLQARLAGAIACIYGYRIDEDRVRTLVILSLLGDAVKEPLKQAGVKVGQKIGENIIKQIPGRVLIEINKKVGFRLLTKAGEKGVVNLVKVVPVLGGVVGGTIDCCACRAVGYTAKKIFRKPAP
jgi:uncharacterized protein (DUF697 family)